MKPKQNLCRKSQQSGQALTEYVLLLTIAIAVALGFASSFGQFLNQGITRFNAQLEKDLRTGGYPEQVSHWEN